MARRMVRVWLTPGGHHNQAALYPLAALRRSSHERSATGERTAMYSACLLSHVRVRQ